MVTKIILIGGSSGTGKSTLSKNISEKLNIIHRIGTGYIREIIRSNNNLNDAGVNALEGYTFQKGSFFSPIEKYKKQCEILIPSIQSCINRSYNEGTSIIIEGAHIIPGLINDERITKTFLLKNPNIDKHFEMIHGPTHFKRKVNELEFQVVKEIQDYLIKKAKKYHIPIISTNNEKDKLELALKYLNEN